MSRMRVTPAMAAAAKATSAVALGFHAVNLNTPPPPVRPTREPRLSFGIPKLNDNSSIKKRMRAARRG